MQLGAPEPASPRREAEHPVSYYGRSRWREIPDGHNSSTPRWVFSASRHRAKKPESAAPGLLPALFKNGVLFLGLPQPAKTEAQT